MNQEQIENAAKTLWSHWQNSTRIDALPAECRPTGRAEAYAIQAEYPWLSGQAVVGWKIAATSAAGQAHIGVDGPLAGRLLKNRVLEPGATISLDGNLMRVAEAEFVFRFGKSLPKRNEEYTVEQVLDAVETLHPAIEIPDSRYHDFAHVGAAQLIADNACASWFLLGAPTTADWRAINLAEHPASAYLNQTLVAEGSGANVLGDPRVALTWIANELRVYGDGLRAGEFVTTGTCVKPVPLAAGDRLRADFGVLGDIEASFS